MRISRRARRAEEAWPARFRRLCVGVVVLFPISIVSPAREPTRIPDVGEALRNLEAPKRTRVVPGAVASAGAPRIEITRVRVEDNRDNDGWADTSETFSLELEVWNRSAIALTHIMVRMDTTDPAIACATLPFARLGDLGPGERRFFDKTEAKLFLIVAPDVERQDASEELTATLHLTATADEVPGPVLDQTITLDLDLDANGGSGRTSFLEGFEEGGLGAFEPMEIDHDLNPPDNDLGNDLLGVQNADGYRCQYADPDWEASWSHDTSMAAVCYPNPNDLPDGFFWYTTTERAYSGTGALHFGVDLGPALGPTTPTAQLEAVRSIDPVNLGAGTVCADNRAVDCQSSADCAPTFSACEITTPQLSFKHQVSLADHRVITIVQRSADRGVVQVQLADGQGDPVGDWIKVYPYANAYDTQANDNFFNCSFDPIDDGNTEENFFDPTDPQRLTGPSSTCFPEFSYSNQGETGSPFDPAALGDADGPGLEGIAGTGTWVEPLIDLSRFRGRRLRLRFLVSGMKLGGVPTWQANYQFNPDPRDDGWFIDDVTVTDTLTDPAVVVPDTKDNSSLPSCPSSPCGFVVVETTCNGGPIEECTPPAGASVELRALGQVDVCVNGFLEYRFWVDTDRNGIPGSPSDILLRDWSEEERFSVASQGSTWYLAQARCSTEPSCNTSFGAQVEIDCPAVSGGPGPDPVFLAGNPPERRHVYLSGDRRLFWEATATVDVIRGSLDALRQNGGFSQTVEACLVDNAVDTYSIPVIPAPDPGATWYYLARSAEPCGTVAGGSWGGVGEQGDRDAALGAELATCGD